MRRVLRNSRGVTVVEFALLAPVLLVTLLGLFDMSYNMYAQALLQGALQQAARSSTIEGASDQTAAIDGTVSEAVKSAIADATLSFSRKSYASFSDVGTAEPFTDTNGDGRCDAGEPYEDANKNGTWDRDQGVSGLGGARDAVLYTAQMTFPRAFPLAGFMNIPTTVTVTASTVLRNQPYDSRAAVPSQVLHCP